MEPIRPVYLDLSNAMVASAWRRVTWERNVWATNVRVKVREITIFESKFLVSRICSLGPPDFKTPFTCKNGICVFSQFVLDGFNDCGDW